MKKVLLLVCIFNAFAFAFAQDADVADFSSLRIMNSGSDGEMLDFAVSSNQRYIAIANENKVIRIFDGYSGKFLRRIEGVHADVLEIALSNDGNRIITLDKSNAIALIDTKTGTIVNQRSFGNNLRGFDMNLDGSRAAVGDSKGTLTMIDTENLETIYEKKLGTQVSSVKFSDNGKYLAVGTGVAFGYMIKTRPIYVLDPESGEQLGALIGAPGATTSITFNKDATRMYTGHKNNTKEIKIWDLTNFSFIDRTSIKVNFVSNTGYNSIYVNQDETLLFATTDDKAIEIFDLKTKEIVSKKGRGKLNLLRGLQYFNKKIYPLGEGNNFLIGGFNQNLLYIFSSAKKGVVGYIHPYNDEWAVVSADGRMDGSIGAIQNLAWRDGIDQIPLENTFDINFTPKLFNELTHTNAAVQEFEVSSYAEAIPVIYISAVNGQNVSDLRGDGAFTSQSKKSSITIRVKENGESIKEVHLFQNAKLIATSTDKKDSYSFEVNLTDAFGKENYFYAVAKNGKGISSEKSKLEIRYTGSDDAPPVLHLVTIGINNYRNPKYDLNYALSDADSLQKYLEAGSKGIFSKVNIYELRDKKALRNEIISVFDKIKSIAKEQDMMIFYYAGHGVMSSDPATKDFYIVPHDVIQMYGRDDLLKEKGVSAAELKEISKGINAQKQVFILDACQSAGALETIAARGATEEKAIAQLARSTGSYWITATGSEQFATEFKDLGHGVFTYTLIEGLQGMADNGDSRITIKELSAYVESRVPELSEKYKGTPQFPSAFSFGNDFPIITIPNK